MQFGLQTFPLAELIATRHIIDLSTNHYHHLRGQDTISFRRSKNPMLGCVILFVAQIENEILHRSAFSVAQNVPRAQNDSTITQSPLSTGDIDVRSHAKPTGGIT